MGFIDEYKRLEKLCGDLLNDDRRISAYIEQMQANPCGAYYVKNWEADLKQLKHCRWIRNKIVHEPNCTEENMSTPLDTQWIVGFYSRILNQTDPLALYYKAIRECSAAGKEFWAQPQLSSNKQGCLADVLAAIAIMNVLVMAMAMGIFLF